jgi:hypothetical protein
MGYVLNEVATCRLGFGRLESARAAATESLVAARKVRRKTEIVVAASILACVEAKAGRQ